MLVLNNIMSMENKRKFDKGKEGEKKKITYIVTPKVNPSTVKMYVQTLAEF